MMHLIETRWSSHCVNEHRHVENTQKPRDARVTRKGWLVDRDWIKKWRIPEISDTVKLRELPKALLTKCGSKETKLVVVITTYVRIWWGTVVHLPAARTRPLLLDYMAGVMT